MGISALYNRPPFTVVVKADGPIKTPKDMEGKTIGGPANDGALKLFPAFAKIAGVVKFHGGLKGRQYVSIVPAEKTA